MDPKWIDIQTSEALGDGVATPYTDGKVFSAAARRHAVIRAVSTYSDYRPAMRLYGTANLYDAVAEAANSAYIMGGGFVKGDTVVLSPLDSDIMEMAVVASVTTVSPYDENLTLTSLPPVLSLSQITFTAPLVNSHLAGDDVVKYPGGSLTLNPGQSNYRLPMDWKLVDRNSFDMAVGRKLTYKKSAGYYDASIGIGMALSGVQSSDLTNVGLGSPYGYPIGGNPFNNPNAYAGVGSGPGPTTASAAPWQPKTFRFLVKEPAELVVIPTPTAIVNLCFFYTGCHTVQSVPTPDSDAILSYAQYAAMTARADAMGSKTDIRIGDYQVRASLNSRELRELAMVALGHFESKVRFRAIAITG